ncbi:MAG: thioredoxin domain-containing protein [Nannocystaceae bacterium]
MSDGHESSDAAAPEGAADEHTAKGGPAGEAKPAKKKGSSIGSVLGFVIALGGGFFIGQWINNRGKDGVELEQGARYKVELRGDEPSRGPADALVTIVEFADYQCPYCEKAAGPLDDVVADYDEDVRLIYKHYPLPSHPKAQPAARAAWAAHQQGKFWELHAWLFEHKAELGQLEAQVRGMGLDTAKFLQDMGSDASAKAVDSDHFAAAKLGVTGTPVFFVNGHRYVGTKTTAQWRTILDAEIDAAEAVVRSGVARAGVYDAIMKDALDRDDSAKGGAKPGDPDPSASYRVTADDRPALGPADALVTVVMFSDFQCPFCSKLAPTVHQLVERNDDVRVVFRNLPLPMHPRAREAAKAALAADRQGKFWAMHDALFAGQARLDEAEMVEFAREIGLDINQFASDMADPALDTRIEEDETLAHTFRIAATPCAFVNGRYVRGAVPVERFEDVIQQERAKAQALVDAGTPRAEVFAKVMASAQTHVPAPEAGAAQGGAP